MLQGWDEQLGKVVDSLKQLYGLRYIYCWHGLSCYWSGVSPYEEGVAKYNARLVFSEVSSWLCFSPCRHWLVFATSGDFLLGLSSTIRYSV